MISVLCGASAAEREAAIAKAAGYGVFNDLGMKILMYFTTRGLVASAPS